VFEPEIVQQLDLLPAVCHSFGFGVGKGAGFEADDFMAAAAAKEVESGGTCLLLTTDRDSYQLASEHVTVLTPRKGARELDRIGPHEVVAYFGVLPEQVPDFKALSGDASDKIPGIRGVGPKAAASLLLKFGSLEGVIENWDRPASDAELALRFREVARMCATGIPLLAEPVDWRAAFEPDWRAGSEALRILGANSLAERVAKLAAT
jgi:DNA polymerase-1